MSLLKNKFLRVSVSLLILSLILIFFIYKSREVYANPEEKGSVSPPVFKSNKSAIEVAREFVNAGMNGDFKKLAKLCCKDSGPYTTIENVRYLDLGDLGYVEKIIREEKSKVDPDNLRLVVVRAKVLGQIGFYCFYVFETPRGYKIYLKGDYLWEYPPRKKSLSETAAWFYATNKFYLNKAAELFEYIVNSNPDDLESLYRLGFIYSLMGRRKYAISQYKMLVIKNKKFAERKLSENDFLSACEELLTSDADDLRFVNKQVLYFAAERLFIKKEDQRAIPVMIELWTEILNSIKEKNKRSILYELEQYKLLIAKYGRHGDKAQIEMYKNAVQMLTKYQGQDAVPALIKTLKSCNWDNFQCCYEEVGAEIIYNLGELKNKRSIQVLIWAIPQTVKPMSSAAEKWAPNLAEALIKLEAKGSVPEMKKIIKKFLIDNRYTLEEISPYLKPLTEFTGYSWSEISWEKVEKTLKRFTSLNWSARGILGGFDKKNYLKASEDLREIANLENFENIKNWVFPIKRKKQRPTFGSEYDLINWRYSYVNYCEVKDNMIYIAVSRHPHWSTHEDIIDESLITLKIINEKIEVYDIQIGVPYPKEDSLKIKPEEEKIKESIKRPTRHVSMAELLNLEREKQKATMRDMTSIATVIADYIIDNGVAPKQNGVYYENTNFHMALSPFYIKKLPIKDSWGNNYRVYCGKACNGLYGISGCGPDDFIIVSFGRDGEKEFWEFDSSDPEEGLIVMKTANDFNINLVMWNGSWIRAARASKTKE